MMAANVADVLVLVRVFEPALVLINYAPCHRSPNPGGCETFDSFRELLSSLLSAFNLRSLLWIALMSEVRVRYRWTAVGRIINLGYGDCSSTLMSTMCCWLHCVARGAMKWLKGPCCFVALCCLLLTPWTTVVFLLNLSYG